jgi:hypothetical protein
MSGYITKPAEYVVGLPVIITIGADGSVGFEIDTAEASSAMRDADYDDIPADHFELVDGEHERRVPVEQRIERAKAEILADVEKGVMPQSVGSFSELHDHVDANGYGGLFDVPFDSASDRDTKLINDLQDAVDVWIKAGGVYQGLIEHAINRGADSLTLHFGAGR